MTIQIMGSCKKHKLYQEQDMIDSEDIISSLPDCILTHILSFLPTKDAVSTCILSSRWRDLWAGLPYIDLDDGVLYFGNMGSWYRFEYEYVPFMNFAEKILIHRQVPNISRFRLSCRVCFCPSRVSEWISSAIRLNVQELDLCLVLRTPFSLPCCIFNCRSLTVLKINMGCALIFPETVSLPHLKTLYLALVEFSNKESTQKLFSNCPALEELYLSDCNWGRLDSVSICIPTLRRLRIDDTLCWDSPNESNDCTIEVQQANLVCFEYFGCLSTEILLPNQSSLLEASFFVQNQWKGKFDPVPRANELINELRNVKLLRISTDTIKSLSLSTRFFGELPVFQNLTHLELSIGIENHFLEALLEFLGSLPHLEILTLAEGLHPLVRRHQDVGILMCKPKCYLSKLKMINLQFVHGSKAEICVLKYLVESAPALERIDIICSGNLSLDSKKNEIRLQVQMLLDSSKGNRTMLSL